MKSFLSQIITGQISGAKKAKLISTDGPSSSPTESPFALCLMACCVWTAYQLDQGNCHINIGYFSGWILIKGGDLHPDRFLMHPE